MANATKRSPSGARRRGRARPKSFGGARAVLARIESELPTSLGDYVSRVETGLNRLEKRIERAGTSARKRATRLLREASKYVGTVEARGEAAWGRLTTSYRKDAVALLDRLEAAIAPPRATKTRGKRARKKPAGR